jgi:molybdenum cofactor synthesis domain-containing protein
MPDEYVPRTPPARDHLVLGPAVEVVSAGNEVLLGDVLDTNTNWLCKRVTALGGHVRRTMMLRDEVETIAEELRRAIARRPALIFTVGGLGPTTDDLTLLGVATALGRRLELHAEAERMVAERYAEFAARRHVADAGMNEARRKMARLPQGAQPLVNRVGGAPGVLLEQDGVTIVSLPGVPGELRAIVDESLGDVLDRIFGTAAFSEQVLVVGSQDESAIAHILADVEAEHPLVYIKSRAQQIGSEHVNRITAAARETDAAAVAALLDPVIAELKERIEATGIATWPGEPE